MSIREDAVHKKITPLFQNCAVNEGISVKLLMEEVAKGTIAIPKNRNHHFEKFIGVGRGLSTKVNANIGSSKDYPEVGQELQKLCVCLKAGADTVMDLSMGGELNEIRREILKNCPVPLGTVPSIRALPKSSRNRKRRSVRFPLITS
jgi:phosphomethylpyrimidine synthase